MVELARKERTIRVVDDQIGCPTWSRSVADATSALLRWMGDWGSSLPEAIKNNSGIYHYSADGETSWYGFARAAIEIDPDRKHHMVDEVLPITSSEFRGEASRPPYSVLATSKIQNQVGILPTDWRFQLAACWASIDGGATNEGFAVA